MGRRENEASPFQTTEGEEMNPRVINLFTASIAFFLTAFFTPWWGSGVVAVVFACMKSSSARLVTISALVGWLVAIFVRDGMNQQGPSRIIMRFFQDMEPEPSILRPLVILAVAAIAALFAGSCAGVVTSARKLWNGRLATRRTGSRS